MMRCDPSGITEVGNLFHLWYTKSHVAHGYDATVWPVAHGVVTMVNIGPEGIGKTLQYAADGLRFSKMTDPDRVPRAPGAYRPEAFTDNDAGQMIEWGLHIGRQDGFLPFPERFDCHWEPSEGTSSGTLSGSEAEK
ncbi:MAG: hypothetical protein JSW27_21330 [Phycisphaerales bacterium]|nr:MAG: hypothetical protein JSW27_21330 [Phycisphaerales bacterium]